MIMLFTTTHALFRVLMGEQMSIDNTWTYNGNLHGKEQFVSRYMYFCHQRYNNNDSAHIKITFADKF